MRCWEKTRSGDAKKSYDFLFIHSSGALMTQLHDFVNFTKSYCRDVEESRLVIFLTNFAYSFKKNSNPPSFVLDLARFGSIPRFSSIRHVFPSVIFTGVEARVNSPIKHATLVGKEQI
jgi:hypothetical protein